MKRNQRKRTTEQTERVTTDRFISSDDDGRKEIESLLVTPFIHLHSFAACE